MTKNNMRKELYLLRHGEAESGYGMRDVERPLTDRGINDITALALQLKKQDFYPDHIYCSTAKRTRQTCQILIEQLDYSLPVDFRQEIYEASVKTLFDLVCSTNPNHHTVLVIGHNPGLSYLFDYFTKRFGNLGPGDMLKIAFENQEWVAVSKGTGMKQSLDF